MAAPVAQAAPRVRAEHVFTTTKPGAAAGRVQTTRVTNEDQPARKPPALQRVEVLLPRGARFKPAARPSCAANDAMLLLAGAGACPGQSVLGEQTAVLDTGAGIVVADYALINSPGQLLIVGGPQDSSLRVVLRATVSGRRLVLDIPLLPGSPPDGTAIRSEHLQLERNGGYLRTPRRCPRNRRWTTRLTYTFRDGERERVYAESPCRRRR